MENITNSSRTEKGLFMFTLYAIFTLAAGIFCITWSTIFFSDFYNFKLGGIVFLVYGVLSVICGVSVMLRKKWSRILIVILASFAVLLLAYSICLDWFSCKNPQQYRYLYHFIIFKGIVLFVYISLICYFSTLKVKVLFDSGQNKT